MKIALIAGSGNFPIYIAKDNLDIFVDVHRRLFRFKKISK